MSTIHSPVESIQSLWFDTLPAGKKVAIVAAVRCGRATVFLGAGGKVYSTQVKAKCAYSQSAGLEDTLNGCKKLGLLTKDAIAKHLAAEKARADKREKRYAAKYLVENAKALGVKLTAAQLAAVNAAQ